MRIIPFLLPAVVTFCIFAFIGCCVEQAGAAQNYTVYIGTYTGAKSQGIYRASFSSETGKLGSPELAAKTTSPSFLALHPKEPVLYAVGESGKEGTISAFRIAKDGSLELLNQQSSAGGGPCHLSLDSRGRCVLVANYGSGTVAALPVGSDGRLEPPATRIQHEGSSVNPKRQAGPHAHHIVADRDDRFVLACDLGLDKVLAYRLDASKALLEPVQASAGRVPPGGGPRHLVFDRNGRFVYVVNEMGSSITSFSYEPKTGRLEARGTVPTLPAGFEGQNSCAEIQLHPSGEFVYASNRGHDSIAAFSVKNGALKPVGHTSSGGRTPRHFEFDPTGKWLLAENQDSDNIVVFAVDRKTGQLTPTGQSIEVGKPVCVVFRN